MIEQAQWYTDNAIWDTIVPALAKRPRLFQKGEAFLVKKGEAFLVIQGGGRR